MRSVRGTSGLYYGWVIVGVSAVANMLASVRSTFALGLAGMFTTASAPSSGLPMEVSALAIAGATVAAWIAAPRNATTFRNARRPQPRD